MLPIKPRAETPAQPSRIRILEGTHCGLSVGSCAGLPAPSLSAGMSGGPPLSIKIRHSVFETNSSSSHSLTVSPGELIDFGLDKETLRKGEIQAVIHADGYGWGYHRFYEPGSKIAYLLFQAVGGRLPAEAAGLGAGEDHIHFFREQSNAAASIINLVHDATGCRIRLTRDREDARYGYYIDHQSAYVGLDLLDDSEQLLKLIFGEGSYIETGNDNSKPGEYIGSDRGSELYYKGRYVNDPEGERFGFMIPEQSGKNFDFSVGVDDVRRIPGFSYGDTIDFVEALSNSIIERFVVKAPIPARYQAKANLWARHLAFKHFGDTLARFGKDLRLLSDTPVDFIEADFKPRYPNERADEYSCEDQAEVTVHAVAEPKVLSALADIVDEIAARHLPLGTRIA